MELGEGPGPAMRPRAEQRHCETCQKMCDPLSAVVLHASQFNFPSKTGQLEVLICSGTNEFYPTLFSFTVVARSELW